MKDRDLMTTIVGGVAAAASAAQPVLNGVQTGSLHQNDWVQLIMAVAMGVWAWATNKK